MDDLQISENTVVDWGVFVREVMVDWAFENTSSMIGGEGVEVEIDESLLGRRKYNRGRIINGTWIFGAIEKESKKLFIVPVKKRSRKVLLRIIKKRIAPGSIILSDKWRAYNCLDKEGYTHKSVNHSTNFVDPISKAHT